ncbi:two-component hyrid sensor and regulator [Bordetella ansorpii]|uniref:histidine kinase n=1 Tax=Bordetella ansorpii TaxID=288768 RepID=A0A157P4H9_9BORD|nr:ATP-binding protein [Bordetella ansorpii]SAI28196.1 two-component hyrid sensor and regulator [Bordetella ansorpii]
MGDAGEGRQVSICAPYGRDAESVSQLLLRDGYHAVVHPDLAALAAGLDEHVGVVLLTEEALRSGADALRAALLRQQDWSDIPFVVLAAARSTRSRSVEWAYTQLRTLFSNAVVLERPLGRKSLLSAIDSALRSRRKQFEMRDRLAERDRARQELAESNARLLLAADAAEIGFWNVDPANGKLDGSPRMRAMFGFAHHADLSLADLHHALHPADAPAAEQAYAAACDPARRAPYDVQYRTVSSDGVVRWVAAKGRGLFDADGVCARVIGTAIDITALKAYSLELRSLNETLEERVKERTDRLMQAEAALRQSQKMEAVGQLTGGIAHDFNNMLTGVIGAMDIMRRRMSAGRMEGLERYMDAASASAQRAATLTARLLAFSRRQSLDARPLDAAQLLRSLEDLLRRTLGERVDLRIITGHDLPFAVADANQLESAILNLVINARDAMPDGGQLTVEAHAIDIGTDYASVNPELGTGRYVVVKVSDTGVGMAPELIEKAFEPFFTTKAVGQGTGLGLSMVYGFARQSGGQVRIHSELGVGTSVSLYLRSAQAQSGQQAASPAPAPPQGGGEHVLVVEDDASVRLLIKDVLEELSYRPVEAAEADAALAILRSDVPIRLMVSDVGLPGMNGRQLAEAARQHRPDLPILFVTGYAENAAIRAGFLGTNMAMITKPFALEALAAKISEMLAQQAAG